MTADRDTTRIVRSWLRTDEHESADRILGTVLASLDATPQRRPWWPSRRSTPLNRFVLTASAVAALLLVAILGYNLLPRTGGVGTQPTVPPTAAPTAAPIDLSSPIDGIYQTTFTKAELTASTSDPEELSDENWGDFQLTFREGLVSFTQRNDVKSSSTSGTFTVTGDAVTLAFDSGVNRGETFGFRWSLTGTVLTFTRDDSLGLPGPTPYFVKTWTRTGSA